MLLYLRTVRKYSACNGVTMLCLVGACERASSVFVGGSQEPMTVGWLLRSRCNGRCQDQLRTKADGPTGNPSRDRNAPKAEKPWCATAFRSRRFNGRVDRPGGKVLPRRSLPCRFRWRISHAGIVLPSSILSFASFNPNTGASFDDAWAQSSWKCVDDIRDASGTRIPASSAKSWWLRSHW